jgi:hypothetical protein
VGPKGVGHQFGRPLLPATSYEFVEDDNLQLDQMDTIFNDNLQLDQMDTIFTNWIQSILLIML